MSRVGGWMIFFALLGACAPTGETTLTAGPTTPPTTRPASAADPAMAISSAVRAYFDQPSTGSLTLLESLVPDAAPNDIPTLLDGAGLFAPVDAGRQEVAAPIGFNQHRRVIIRTPRGYDPTRAYPTIIAYHTWGGTADRILDRVEAFLGDDVEQFVVAAPDDYRQTVIDAPPPVSAEHVSVWRTVKVNRHVDDDRLYLMGYSLGGETIMTMTALHGHTLASAIGMANTFGLPSDVPGLWSWFARNLGDVPILHTWGADDATRIVGLNGRDSDATLAGLNQELQELLTEFPEVPYTPVELPGVGHEGAYPPLDDALRHLAAGRGPLPTTIRHTFRYIHQADTAWIEGHEWGGLGWLEPEPTAESGLDRASEAVAIHDLLGSIDAEVVDNVITISIRHLDDFTVWLHPDLVDFAQPVTIIIDGVEAFSKIVAPDYSVAMIQAERTREFTRIRHAGVRIVDGLAHVVTELDEFPPIARGITLGSR